MSIHSVPSSPKSDRPTTPVQQPAAKAIPFFPRFYYKVHYSEDAALIDKMGIEQRNDLSICRYNSAALIEKVAGWACDRLYGQLSDKGSAAYKERYDYLLSHLKDLQDLETTGSLKEGGVGQLPLIKEMSAELEKVWFSDENIKRVVADKLGLSQDSRLASEILTYGDNIGHLKTYFSQEWMPNQGLFYMSKTFNQVAQDVLAALRENTAPPLSVKPELKSVQKNPGDDWEQKRKFYELGPQGQIGV